MMLTAESIKLLPILLLLLLLSGKDEIHYTSFPVASPQQTSWRGQKSVVPVVSCRLPNSINLQRLVANQVATSWQLPRLRRSYGEMCLMDFEHNAQIFWT